MIKNIIIISIIYCSTIDIIQAQQLSKKMGTHVNGERYRGSYKNGIKDGFGEWTHPDGDIYRGKFKAGVMSIPPPNHCSVVIKKRVLKCIEGILGDIGCNTTLIPVAL